ncbi:sulfotransferase domain-containing protein [Saccharomonospora sp. NPDC006951]
MSGLRRDEDPDWLATSHEIERANLRKLGSGDILVASFPCSGQFLTGNVLLELGLNYLTASSEEFAEDGLANPLPVFSGVRRRFAARDRSDGAGTARRRWPRFVATHSAPRHLDASVLRGALLLVRDPRDAVYSQYCLQVAIESDRVSEFAAENKETIVPREVPSFDSWLGQEMSLFPEASSKPPVEAWTEYYSEWLNVAGGDRLFVMRFEDLKTCASDTVRKGLNRCGIGVAEADLARAIELSSFQAMRKHEDDILHERGTTSGEYRFMRRGLVGEWKQWMTPERAVHFSNDRFREVASSLGYVIG